MFHQDRGNSLLREIRVDPLFPDIQHRKVISSWLPKVLVCLVGVHFLVFWSVKQCMTLLKHRNDRQYLERKSQLGVRPVSRLTYLFCAMELLALDDRLGQHRIHRELGHPPPQPRQLALVIQRS